MHQAYVLYQSIRCVFTIWSILSETQRKEKSAVAGPTPQTESLFQTVQGLIGTFYQGDPLHLAEQIFPSIELALEGGPDDKLSPESLQLISYL